MERPVEVAVFQRGELQSVRTLSPRRERRAAVTAAALGAALVLAAMVVTIALVALLNVVVHGPTFVVGWIGAALAVAVVSGRRARERSRRYALGVRLEADAFASTDVDLVRRVGRADDYDVGLTPGMVGVVEGGRAPLPIEALTRTGSLRVPLPAAGKVQVELGATTFIIRRSTDAPEPHVSIGHLVMRQGAAARRLVPLASAGVPMAILMTLLGSVQSAMALGEADMRSSIDNSANHWEIEQAVRRRAQKQVATLHRCFDSQPMACQRPGYVGVRVALAKDGEVRAAVVSRSTFGAECPVSECMANVVEQWYFEPMPEPMKVVIPIQVRRTGKPLFEARGGLPVVLGDPGDAGALQLRAMAE